MKPAVWGSLVARNPGTQSNPADTATSWGLKAARASLAITPESPEAPREKAEVLAEGRQRQSKIVPPPTLGAAAAA